MSDTAADALELTTKVIAQQKNSSIGSDIARRAVVQSHSQSDRALGFAVSLFVSASDYLVSRDIHSLIGAAPRLSSVADMVALKNEIRHWIGTQVAEHGAPSDVRDAQAWRKYVAEVTARLKK
jgi:hypothetical protein